jgi:hypothetical protein
MSEQNKLEIKKPKKLQRMVALVKNVPQKQMLGYIRNMHPQVRKEELQRLDYDDLLAFKLNYCAILFDRTAIHINVATSELRDALQPLVKFHRENINKPIRSDDPTVRQLYDRTTLHLNALSHITSMIKEDITRLENANCVDGETAKAMRSHAESISSPYGALSLIRSIYGLTELTKNYVQDFREAADVVADELMSKLSGQPIDNVKNKPAYVLTNTYITRTKSLLDRAYKLLSTPSADSKSIHPVKTSES